MVVATSVSVKTSDLTILVGILGSAWLVNHKSENKQYVAKKVILQGLSDREQAGCMMEAGILKSLNHPNIVGYKESFLGNNSLTIIMEYCEGKSNC